MIMGAFRSAIGIIRSSIGYLGFTATLFTGVTLLLKREFIDAGLLYLTRVIGPFQRVYEFAQQITAFWDGLIVQPIARILTSILNVSLPIILIEIATLIIFAIGPVIRWMWTTNTMRREIALRKTKRDELKALVDTQSSELAQLRASQAELQSALDKKDMKKLKRGAELLGSAGLVGLSLFLAPQTIGRQAYNVKISFEALKDSFSGWKNIETNIKKLSAKIDERSSELEELEDQVEQMESADKGLLKRVSVLSKEEAESEIAAYVSHRMKLSLLLSTYSLAIVGAVLFSYGVDWFYQPELVA